MLCVDSVPLRGKGQAKQFADAMAKSTRKAPRFRADVSAKAGDGVGIRAKITLRALDKTYELPAKAELIAVLFQKKATTKCTAGENKGKTLHEIFIVRGVSKPLDLKAALGAGAEVRFAAPKGVKPADLGVAFLFEDRAKAQTIDCWWTAVTPPAASPTPR